MILTDYFRAKHDSTWDLALQCGVKYGTIRLPEDEGYDVCSLSQLKAVTDGFLSYGIKPVIVEPLPNSLHDHIKLGDSERDRSIEDFIKLMKNLHEVGIETVCFNFMAHYGWTRTSSSYPERGGATVTGFDLSRFTADETAISHEKIWENYNYFIKAAVPYAEKYDIKLALHPDDPPLPSLGSVGRIFTSYEAVNEALHVVESPYLGATFCQACYKLMGERLEDVIPKLKDKIFFVHFRNIRGNKTCFTETFHDNGDINMANAMKLYYDNRINVPIRVDHVPTLLGEETSNAGYDALGRLFAIGYLKGLIESFDSLHN